MTLAFGVLGPVEPNWATAIWCPRSRSLLFLIDAKRLAALAACRARVSEDDSGQNLPTSVPVWSRAEQPFRWSSKKEGLPTIRQEGIVGRSSFAAPLHQI